MDKLKRGDKLYLDNLNTKPSRINHYLDCRDGVIELVEYNNCSGYGANTRLFLCKDHKHETVSIIRQTWIEFKEEWEEDEMTFDSDSFEFLESLINNKNLMVGKYFKVRDYENE